MYGADYGISTRPVASGGTPRRESIVILLSTLRFKEGEDIRGFNVARIIRRKKEENLSPRSFSPGTSLHFKRSSEIKGY